MGFDPSVTLRAALTTGCLMLASTAWSATVEELERALRAIVAAQAATDRERAILISDAATLVDVISSLQDRSTRASPALENQLRRFDRVSGLLDAIDRKHRGQEADCVRVRSALVAEIDRESRQVERTAMLRPAASRIVELESARRRSQDLCGAALVRPLLDVSAAATDTVADLDQKLALFAVERQRGVDVLSATDRELAVVEGRTMLTRRLLDQMDSLARGAPQDLRLMQRQVEQVQQNLRALDVQRAALRTRRGAFVDGLATIEKRTSECLARRRALIRPDAGGAE